MNRATYIAPPPLPTHIGLISTLVSNNNQSKVFLHSSGVPCLEDSLVKSCRLNSPRIIQCWAHELNINGPECASLCPVGATAQQRQYRCIRNAIWRTARNTNNYLKERKKKLGLSAPNGASLWARPTLVCMSRHIWNDIYFQVLWGKNQLDKQCGLRLPVSSFRGNVGITAMGPQVEALSSFPSFSPED